MRQLCGRLAAVFLALLLAARTRAQPIFETAASNTSTDSDAFLADLWQYNPQEERASGHRASQSRRRTVRSHLKSPKARRGWLPDAYPLAASRVADRVLSETQQTATQPSLPQLYAAATQQLQAKAAQLQSYATQAAAVTDQEFGSFARVAQVQLQQSGPPPPLGTPPPQVCEFAVPAVTVAAVL
jgi:hypothetical protein